MGSTTALRHVPARTCNIVATGEADEDAPAPAADTPSATPPQAGAELRVDGDERGAGVIALVASAALIPLLAVGVATSLGMGFGTADNDGIGSPLTTEEVRALSRAQAERDSGARQGEGDEGRVASLEEAAEEQALVDILSGGIRRAR